LKQRCGFVSNSSSSSFLILPNGDFITPGETLHQNFDALFGIKNDDSIADNFFKASKYEIVDCLLENIDDWSREEVAHLVQSTGNPANEHAFCIDIPDYGEGGGAFSTGLRRSFREYADENIKVVRI
jgi:hypothetical protein